MRRGCSNGGPPNGQIYILLTRRELQTRSSGTKRQRRLKCEEKKRKSEGAETANAQEGCRWHSQQDQTSDQETDQTTDLPRPAQPPRRCDDRRAASGDRLAATQCARLPGWGRQKEARPHARIGEAGRGAPPISHFQRGLTAMAEAGLPKAKQIGAARDIEVSRRLEALPALSPDELRKEWRRLYRSQPPRLSRDLLVRAIAYRIQELRYGGLSKATSRKLAALVQARRSDAEIATEGAQRIRAGARLGARMERPHAYRHGGGGGLHLRRTELPLAERNRA